MFFIAEKQQKNSKLFLKFISCSRRIQTMEHQKMSNLLNESSDSRFFTMDSDIMNNQSNPNYSTGNEIMYNTEVLKFNLCDYNDANILVRGDISIVSCVNPTEVSFKNCVQFIKCIPKIDGSTKDDVEDLLGHIHVQFVRIQFKLF